MNKLSESQIAACREGVAWEKPQDVIAALLEERELLRSLLKDGFAYVRDANQLMAAEGDLDEDDEDGANEWLVSAAAALT